MFLILTSILIFILFTVLVLQCAIIVYEDINNLKSRILKNTCIVLMVGIAILLEVVLAIILIKDYNGRSDFEVVSSITKLERVQILSMTKPKHVYIDLVNLNTGERSNGIYVSKHCIGQDMNDIGAEMEMEVTYFQYKNGTSSVMYNTSYICN